MKGHSSTSKIRYTIDVKDVRGDICSEEELLARLEEAERLYLDFKEVTPFKYEPFVKSFDTFDEYEKWKNEQTNPWYR